MLGAFLDMSATILICTPIFVPICQQYGMDPPQFVGCAIGGISVGQIMRSICPFYGALIATLMLVTYVPAFFLWLPGLAG